jgi:hypothetical protein
MYNWRAVRISKPFGIQQPYTGPFAGADNHQSAMRRVAA